MIDTTEQYDAVVANLNDTFDRGLASKELCFFESSRSLYEEGGIEVGVVESRFHGLPQCDL